MERQGDRLTVKMEAAEETSHVMERKCEEEEEEEEKENHKDTAMAEDATVMQRPNKEGTVDGILSPNFAVEEEHQQQRSKEGAFVKAEDVSEKEELNTHAADDADDGFLDFLNSSPSNDEGTVEEQIAFVRELEKFFSDRKMEYKHPVFYGANLNCLKLWRMVIRLGGYESVTTKKLWRQVGDTFHPPRSCTTVSWSFRRFYKKVLFDYEMFKLHGIEPSGSQEIFQSDASLQAGEGPASISVADSLQPSSGIAPASGRARRHAAARAMQGWHSQRLLSNGEVGDPIIKDKASSSAIRREKQLKNIGIIKKKKPSSLERAVKAACKKCIRAPFPDDIINKEEFGVDVGRPTTTIFKNKYMKPDHSKQLLMGNSLYNRTDVLIVDEGPPADWVKINVHKTRDCFEVYALVPGLLREEVRIQCEPGGQLVIAGEPEQPDNPWGVTSFRKVVTLPLSIDVHQTSAVVTLHGQLFVRVPYAQQSL